MTASPVPWRHAWHQALYGHAGFFRTNRPADHFATSAHLPAFAGAIAELAARINAPAIVDLAAGGGELLAALEPLTDGVRLVGVEIADRPAGLSDRISWVRELPGHVEGLLVANEWLDNIPCDVVEVDDDGVVREVLVDPTTGTESLGATYDSPWLDTWWPLPEPGARAEVGRSRDDAWADVVERVDGLAVAIDYGHHRDDRPPLGTLRSYASGRELDVVPDGSRDVTAHVAVDAVAAASGGFILSQREALIRLGLTAERPPLDRARTDPGAYVQALGRSSETGELLARGGLGDFWWIVADTAGRGTLSA